MPLFNFLFPVGSFCIIDLKPRELSDEEIKKFREMGEMIKKEILRRDASECSASSGGDGVSTEGESTSGEEE